MRALLAVTLLLLVVPAASALPGDPPPVPLTPAEGATVPANAAGVPITFSCPRYRKDVYGDEADPITDYGTSEDYEVNFSPSPQVDATGILGDEYRTEARVTASGDTCTTALDTQDSGTSPEAVGGTVYWQVHRPCLGCLPTQNEVSPVRSFAVVAPKLPSRVKTPRHVYAGYLTKLSVTTTAAVSGAKLALQRRTGKAWRTIEVGDAGQSVDLFVRLPKGKQTLRAVITTVGGSSAGTPKVVRVRPDRHRSTSGRDDGRYAETNAHATVKKRGHVLTGFSTPVTANCFGATVEENHIMILFAGIDNARIAPDGSVVARLQTKSKGAEVQLTGTVKHGHFKGEAFIYIRAGNCSGFRTVDLRRK